MLTRNSLMEEITSKIAHAKPDWEEVVKRFVSTYPGNRGFYSDQSLRGHLSEMHLRVSLEKACAEYGSRVIFDPIPKGAITEDFIFDEAPGSENLAVFKKMIYDKNKLQVQKKGETYSEIDLLLLVDGVPLLFEAKISKYKTKGVNVKDPSSGGPDFAFRPERVDYLLRPIRQFFNSEEGNFAVMICSDTYNYGSIRKKDFMKAGGIIIPFYAKRNDFPREVEQIKKEFYL